MDLAVIGFRFLLGFVFFASSIPKLAARHEFSRAVANYRLLPSRLTASVARALPPLELACSLALLIGVAVPYVAFVVAALLLAFAAAVAVNLARGRTIDCGCRGAAAPRRISWRVVARDVALAAMAAAIVAQPADGAAPNDIVALAIAASAVVVLNLLLDDAWRTRKDTARVAGLLLTEESP